jgi:parallel beta-helix repeat protein
MEKKKSIVLGMAIAAVFLIAMVGSASAATEITSLPYNANVQGEYYYLTQHLSSSDTSTAGINIAADDITIDGQGNSITGSKAPGACAATEHNPAVHSGVRIRGGSYDNAVIKDLEIKEFCTGIALGWLVADNVDNVTVTGCTIHDNGQSTTSTHGMHMYCTNNCNITGNDIYNNDGSGVGGGCSGGGDGIFMFGEINTERGWYNEITWNKLHDNTKSGFFMKHMCMYNTISNNTAYGNVEEGGFSLMCMHSAFNNVTDNNASWNTGWGIEIGGYNNTLKRNRITNNTQQGIYLNRGSWPYGSHHNKIVDNNHIWDNNIGIEIVAGAKYNNISYNIQCICYNPANDIKNDESTTYGDYNTCDTTVGYCDGSAGCPPPCVYQCPGSGPDLVVVDKHETWVGNDYTVTFTVKNIGNEAAGASNTRVWIEGNVQGTYPCSALDPGDTNTTTTGTINLVSAPDIIKVCADINNAVNEYGHGGEDNNCKENVFGAPDLEITGDWEIIWVDPSWKTYNLRYTVKNVGDKATAECWTNFTELNGEWAGQDCNDYVPELAVSQTDTGTVGPFSMLGEDDWLQAYVDYTKIITENHDEETFPHPPPDGELHYQFEKYMPTYAAGGPCWDSTGAIAQCGDAALDGGVGVEDAQKIFTGGYTCAWAANAKCDGTGAVGIEDAQKIFNGDLNCCEGCELP